MGAFIKALLLTFLIIFTGGCFDYREPDEIAWVLALGIDKGKQNKLTVTAVIAIPKNLTGGGGGQPAGGGEGGKSFFTVSLEAPTLLSALELLNSVVDRRANLSHTKWIVFSRELAEEDIGRYIAPLSRFHQFRHTTTIVISQTRAEELLKKGTPIMEDNVSKYYELMHQGWRYTNFIPFDTFHDFYLKSKMKGVDPVLALASIQRKKPVYSSNTPKPVGEYHAGAIPRRGGGNIEIMGGAIFKNGRMVGILDGNETGVVKMFSGTFKRTILSLSDPRHPDKYVIVMVKPRQKPSITVLPADTPKVRAEILLEGDIISIQSGENYETPEGIKFIERAIERELQREVKKTIALSQDKGVDIFGFGLHAKRYFKTWQEWEDYNWDSKYPMAQISATVSYKIRRIGLVHETVPIK